MAVGNGALTPSSSYRGRFAPSPTGPLHLGSLVTALAGYLDARVAGGKWLLRIDDLDPPRTLPGAADTILRQLESHGLHWDERVLWQSQRQAAYQLAVAQLDGQGLLYPCGCSRAEIRAGGRGDFYPGTCAAGLPPGRQPRGLRVRVSGQIGFNDRLYGAQSQVLPQACGDFIVRRADSFYSYQLAVVVDDAYQGITQVVRGADLLASTPRQIYLQRILALGSPDYLHLPLVLDPQGRKLAKQTGAAALLGERAETNLLAALRLLGHSPPAEVVGAGVSELLGWALSHWSIARLAHTVTVDRG